MKQFAVELKRTSYVTVYVDAETKEQAEDKVWNEAEYGAYDDGDASWECSHIYDVVEGQLIDNVSGIKTLGELEAESTDGFRNPERD
jgi:hypothetical protein